MIRERYLEWLYDRVNNRDYSHNLSYHALFDTLYSIPFRYSLPLDGDRAGDGIELRYRFGSENDISQHLIMNTLDDRPCSVLEMLLALCARCEEHIMHDSTIGDRTGKWFWAILDNLKLTDYDDLNFDADAVRRIVDIFVSRRYKPDGTGGIVTLPDCSYDLRTIEIWDQMMWWLNYILEDEEVSS